MSSSEEEDSSAVTATTRLSQDLDDIGLDTPEDVVMESQSQESLSQSLVEMQITVNRHLQHVLDLEQRLNERDKFIEYILSKLSQPQKKVVSKQWKRLQANQGL